MIVLLGVIFLAIKTYFLKNVLALVAIVISLFAIIPTWYVILRKKTRVQLSVHLMEALGQPKNKVYSLQIYNNGERQFQITGLVLKLPFFKRNGVDYAFTPQAFLSRNLLSKLEPGQSESLDLIRDSETDNLVKRGGKFYVVLNNGDHIPFPKMRSIRAKVSSK